MDGQTRRDVLKVAGVAGAAALLSSDAARAESPAEIVSHRSTTGVIVPPRGASFMKFSFDAPEPSVRFAGFDLGFTPPAPGRGSSGVHESGFSRFDPQTLSLPQRDGLLPTLTIVDDTYAAHRSEMIAVIREARRWAGLG